MCDTNAWTFGGGDLVVTSCATCFVALAGLPEVRQACQALATCEYGHGDVMQCERVALTR